MCRHYNTKVVFKVAGDESEEKDDVGTSDPFSPLEVEDKEKKDFSSSSSATLNPVSVGEKVVASSSFPDDEELNSSSGRGEKFNEDQSLVEGEEEEDFDKRLSKGKRRRGGRNGKRKQRRNRKHQQRQKDRLNDQAEAEEEAEADTEDENNRGWIKEKKMSYVEKVNKLMDKQETAAIAGAAAKETYSLALLSLLIINAGFGFLIV